MFSGNFFVFFFTYINMFKDSSAEYYQNNRERLQKKARERYQSLSKEEKEKKWQYGRELCKIRPEDEKKSLLSVEKNTIK